MRLSVSARGNEIGLVTLVRRDDDPVTASEMGLLRLLVDQVAIAVQNARDYRDRLEQAIRDPLTGLLNRRFVYEAFAKEVERCQRYGTTRLDRPARRRRLQAGERHARSHRGRRRAVRDRA